jgi:membrane protease YdiL (CAAX protease family)
MARKSCQGLLGGFAQMLQSLSRFLSAKEHQYQEISPVQMYKNRAQYAGLFLVIFTAMALLNALLLYFVMQNQLTGSRAADIGNIFLVFVLLLALYFSPYHPRHYGLNLNHWRYNLMWGGLWGVVLGALAVVYRVVMVKQGDALSGFYFSYFSIFYRLTIYVVVSLCQEIVARGYMQSLLVGLFDGIPYARLWAIILASLVFAQLHIMMGLGVFVVAFIFGCLAGFFYERSRSILGVFMIHYIGGLGLLLFSSFDLYLR